MNIEITKIEITLNSFGGYDAAIKTYDGQTTPVDGASTPLHVFLAALSAKLCPATNPPEGGVTPSGEDTPRIAGTMAMTVIHDGRITTVATAYPYKHLHHSTEHIGTHDPLRMIQTAALRGHMDAALKSAAHAATYNADAYIL